MELNPEQFRSFVQGLSGSEKAAFAQKMGVSTRTVQRWGIDPGSGKQARNFIPTRIATKPPMSWPIGYKQRANTAEVLRNGLTRAQAPNLSSRTFTEKFSNIRDGLRYLKALATGDVDKWLASGWAKATLRDTKSGIEIDVEYVGGGGIYGFGGSVSEGDFLPPDGLLDVPGTDDPFGDILLSAYRDSSSR